MSKIENVLLGLMVVAMVLLIIAIIAQLGIWSW